MQTQTPQAPILPGHVPYRGADPADPRAWKAMAKLIFVMGVVLGSLSLIDGILGFFEIVMIHVRAAKSGGVRSEFVGVLRLHQAANCGRIIGGGFLAAGVLVGLLGRHSVARVLVLLGVGLLALVSLVPFVRYGNVIGQVLVADSAFSVEEGMRSLVRSVARLLWSQVYAVLCCFVLLRRYAAPPTPRCRKMGEV